MTPDSVIRSRQNPVYKQIRSLLRRDKRQQERAFLVEGPRFIKDAIESGNQPHVLVASEAFSRSLDWETRNVRYLSNELFESISDTSTSQGIIGVFAIPIVGVPHDRVPLILIADGIQDPGNLGTLIRSAAGAGASQVIVLPGTTDPWAPKAIRAAAAAHFLISIRSMSVSELERALPEGCRIFAAEAEGAVRYDNVQLSEATAIAVGGEGNGLSDALRSLQPVLLAIPLSSGLESLNAAVAGSILLFEAARQRNSIANQAKSPVSG